MSNDLRLSFIIDAKGGQKLSGELRVASKELDKLAGGTGRYAKQTRTAAQASDQMRNSIMSVHRHVLRYGVALAGAVGVRNVIRHADAWTGVTNSLVSVATQSAILMWPETPRRSNWVVSFQWLHSRLY